MTIVRHLDRALAYLLTTDEVCAQLRISKRTLQLLRKNRNISFVALGPHSIRFRQEDVERFINRRQKEMEFADFSVSRLAL